MDPLATLRTMAAKTTSDRVGGALMIALAEDAPDRIVALRAAWMAARWHWRNESCPHRKGALWRLQIELAAAGRALQEADHA